MPAITIRGVPDEVRNELAARAARSGRSMQEYLRGELIRLADRPDAEAVLARIAEQKRRTETRISAGEILALLDAERAERP